MNAPLGYLHAAGERARTILPLTWFTLGVAMLVCLIIGACLMWALRRSRRQHWPLDMRSVTVARRGSGLMWIGVGCAVSAVPLLVILVWTMQALASTAAPPARPMLSLDVTARQWWWQVRYDADSPDAQFATANEIHIPVGEPVLVRLHSADVIHSFWVPQLAGKTDAIPGRTIETWLQADEPGHYAGQCTEFCGAQHAHMGLAVIAEPEAQFEAWRANQLRAASPPDEPHAMHGAALFEFRCGLCHQVRGTSAGAVAGPDLTHVASRERIAAGVLPNNAPAMANWIQNAQHVKPGSLMPDQHLADDDLRDVVVYLETLQ